MSSRSLNRATLIGRLGNDPEIRVTPQGSTVCKLSVATSEKYKDRNGEWQEVTDWHNVVIWDKLAEVAGQYLKKGNQIFIEGKIKTRSYDKDGIKFYTTEIVAQSMIMLSGSKPGEGGYESASSYSGNSNSMDSHLTPDDNDEIPF